MADRANGILLDTSIVVAHLRGSLNVFSLTAPSEPLFLPLATRDSHFGEVDGLDLLRW